MFVLEDLVIRKYATGKQTSGTSWMLTSGSGFATLKQETSESSEERESLLLSSLHSLKDGDDENRAADSGKS